MALSLHHVPFHGVFIVLAMLITFLNGQGFLQYPVFPSGPLESNAVFSRPINLNLMKRQALKKTDVKTTGTHGGNSIQQKGSKLYERCYDDDSCTTENTYCEFSRSWHGKIGQCLCKPGFYNTYLSNRCFAPTALIGEQCQSAAECLAYPKSSQAYCTVGAHVCDCRPGYTHSNDLTDCLKIVNTLDNNADTCEEDGQCQLGTPGPLSVCAKSVNKIKVCQCGPEAVLGVGHECVEKVKKVGDNCTVQLQCTASSLKFSRCVKGTCVCHTGYAANSDKTKCEAGTSNDMEKSKE